MGIKGIYKEIGPGKRISLTKLAVEKLEQSGRPLRIAIDISIWQFQVQAARGGSNPAIRTLFYRLLRLLGLSIQPIFVFDGPNKPTFKRNKRSGRGDGVATAMAKRLIRLFGFIVHDAPGEAEAECALLQQNGIVDAVLSEDVDTIMFGCTRTLRNWSAEGTKGAKTPTHVSMYDSQELAQGDSGLDREGMVLVALMSGGDYLPEGIPGAGVKLACEAAKAGFGKSLCQLKRANTSELVSWKEWLTYELRHNESGFFRTRHKALNIPDDFPNMDILRYYTHPVVSPATTLDRLRQEIWDKPIDVQGLREFVRETFDWSYRIGAVKFIRVLAPCLLVRKIIQCPDRAPGQAGQEPSALVKAISTRRTHFSTDATPEIRLSFIPSDIVGYNFQEEPDEVIDFGRDGLALNSDNEMEDIAEELGDADATSKSGPKKVFSPTEPVLLWIPETIARVGIPSMVDKWEETQRAKTVARSRPKTSKQKAKSGVPAAGSLDKFVRVTKNNLPQATTAKQTFEPPASLASSPVRTRPPLDSLPASPQSTQPLFTSRQETQKSRPVRPSKLPTSQPSRSRRKPPVAPKADANTNPWTIASSQGSPRVTKFAPSTSSAAKAPEPILISSSPPSSPSKGVASPMSHYRDTYHHTGRDSFTMELRGPRKRRSLTLTTDEVDASNRKSSRDSSPSPSSPAMKSQRRLARTESLPIDSSPHRPERRSTKGLARAQTVAVEILPSDSEAGEEHNNSDEDDGFELPPLSSLINKIPTTKASPTTTTTLIPSSPSSAAKIHPKIARKQAKDNPRQTNLKESLKTTRMTKLYMPRKSQPGFFREIDVDADKADALKEEFIAAAATSSSSSGGGRRLGIWRRSDVSCIDLTGED
ncbi:hypothetical protein NPX13_g6399 [Xylaria arbuscula]|uniref:XPG-I domain-containing protein n=1 Tax=Xylaria arbuscula TaxID=114810 RepID=A0A9W8NCM4_9PEZI|nr:hypothetical protein NPX13_g6399 [Xylaria arbuscula]